MCSDSISSKSQAKGSINLQRAKELVAQQQEVRRSKNACKTFIVLRCFLLKLADGQDPLVNGKEDGGVIKNTSACTEK